jgi:hypothetical protein
MRFVFSICLLLVSVLNLKGQEFAYSGYIYDGNEVGAVNVPVELHTKSISNYTITTPTYSNYNYGGGTSVSGCDDCVQGPFNIGFTFTYFGNNYTQVYASSNGWVGFSANQTNGYTAQFLPNSGAPKNAILADWEDLFPNTGNMNYYTTGTSPNRVFVFNFNNTPHYSCRTTYFTFQIVLYESSNNIDINVLSKPNCSNNASTMGLTNSDGTKVVPVGGKNATVWSISSGTKYRFTPSSVQTSFSLNRIVYTNSNGQYNFTSTGLDINNYEFQIKIPTPSTKSSLSNTDANHATDIVLGKTSLTSREYYRMDVNNDGRVNVSDAFVIYGKKSGLISTWGSLPSVRLFTPTEWNTIKTGTTNLKSTITGSQSITISSPVRNGSSNYYLITTGFSNKNKLTY